jgi:hypothetical protein
MTEHSKGRTSERASRREFLRTAAAGAVGAAFVAGGASPSSAAGRRLGVISLDALLVTYLAAPVGENVSADYTPGRAYDTTISLATSGGLALRASVPDADKYRYFARRTYEQAESERERAALTFAAHRRKGETETIGITSGGADRTAVLALLRPRVEIVGSPERPRFRFAPDGVVSDPGSLLLASVEDLRSRQVDLGVAPATAASFLAAIPTDAASVAGPRFEFLGSLAPPFALVRAAGDEPRERAHVTTTATIVASDGFEAATLADAFAVGAEIAVEHSSVQQDRTGALVRAEVNTDGGPGPVQDAYWDTVLKAFAFVERA